MNRIITRLVAVLLMLFLPTAAALAQANETPGPKQVTIGFYINDISDVDMRSNSYSMDFYLWFRWTDPKMDPVSGFEFMNLYGPDDQVQKTLFDTPVPQPDGSLYQIVRHQGRFANRFPLNKYPFDDQTLLISLEDSQQGAKTLRYTLDKDGLKLNPEIRLTGFELGKAAMLVRDMKYDTFFGDHSNPNASAYSRAEVTIPIRHPVLSGFLKVFVPVFMIVLCAALALMLDPAHVEARIGLSITSLLTLVAMQFTMVSNLPEVSYLTLMDQLYLVSYCYVVTAIGVIVRSTRTDQRGDIQGGEDSAIQIAARGPNFALLATCAYLIAVIAITAASLWR